MPNLLTIDHINRIAFCEQGMNPEAQIVLWKAVPAEGGGGTTPPAKKRSRKSRGGKAMADEINLDELEDDVRKAIEDALEAATKGRTDAEAKVTGLETRIAELEKAPEKVDPPTEDELMKTVPQAVRDRLEKAEKSANDNAETVAKLLRKSREAEFTAIAEDYAHVGKSDELGVLLLDIADVVSEETLKSLRHVLKTANARIDLTKELGTLAHDEDDDLEKAVANVRKANPSITREQAVARALADNPSLYKPVG